MVWKRVEYKRLNQQKHSVSIKLLDNTCFFTFFIIWWLIDISFDNFSLYLWTCVPSCHFCDDSLKTYHTHKNDRYSKKSYKKAKKTPEEGFPARFFPDQNFSKFLIRGVKEHKPVASDLLVCCAWTWKCKKNHHENNIKTLFKSISMA